MSKSTSKKSTKATQAARVSSKTKKNSSNKLTTATLRTLNFIASFLLLAQAVALVLLSDKTRGDVGLTANYLTRDPITSDAAGQTVLSQATDHLVSVNLSYLAAAFLVLAALATFAFATRYRLRYDNGLTSGANQLRWISYIFSGGALMLTGALIVGISDIAMLLALLALIVVACVAAMNFERQRLANGLSWVSRIAHIAALVPVALIGLYVLMAHVYGGGLPLKTLITVGVLGLGLLVFYLAASNAYKTNTKASQYLATERVYLVFGFLVPSAFAWAIFSLLLK